MKKMPYFVVLFAVLLSACGFGGNNFRGGFRLTQQAAQAEGGSASETPLPAVTFTPLPTDTSTPRLLATLTATPKPEVFPLITFTQNTNCRKGPGIHYYAVMAFQKGATAKANGRNEDGSWLWVQLENNRDYCWVTASTAKDIGDVSVLSVIPYHPLPAAPTGLSMTKKVCGATIGLRFDWDAVFDAQGYRIYHEAALVWTLAPGFTYAFDYPHNNSKTFIYAVEAFNEYGVSPRVSISEPGC